MTESVIDQAKRAKTAARRLSSVSSDIKNNALLRIASALERKADLLEDANRRDRESARNQGISEALLDRLTLNERRIGAMAEGLRQIAALPDPVGQLIDGTRRPNGLDLQRVRVPLGVIGIIYESRPNVTIDAVGLCLKSGNAAILRGGSEALQSNLALTQLCSREAELAGLPPDSVQLIGTPDREAALTLMRAEGLVDVLIVRGGNALKRSVLENARVPVLASLGGNCHTYIDASADLKMASDIALNAKVSRPSVCNAMETLLIHSSVAEPVLECLAPRLISAGVEIRGCDRTRAIVPQALSATESDWETEYLCLTLAVRVVDSLDDALDHIAAYGSGHSEAIVTRDYEASQRFVREIDAACVYVNASTRFTDGFEFGLGAEVGISTQKLHARGPIGLADLTTSKTIVRGNGQIRE
jgi:glutamate-5-semialdehyde dehydrogenase